VWSRLTAERLEAWRCAEMAKPETWGRRGLAPERVEQARAELRRGVGVMEAHPALALTPEQHAQQVAAAVKKAREDAAESAKWASTQLATASGELRGIVGSATDQLTQQWREWAMAALGAAMGFMMWWPLLWILPWGLGDRLASTVAAGEGRWGAGETLMREADPEAWGRMARLYKACPADASTDLCEAAMAVRTVPPAGQSAAPTPPEAKAPAFGTVPGPLRGKAGQGH